MGIPKVVAKLEALAATHGPQFKPARLLVDIARKDKWFFAAV
jgi:hypothetical protein